MFHRTLTICCLIILISSFLLSGTSMAQSHSGKTSLHSSALADFPTVDPNYIYDQLFYMVTHYQHREAGYDNNLPVNVNGHDEFANYWTQEITKDLQGFGPQTYIDKFPVKGWTGRPATVPAFNVEVSVPGVVHPEQVVVIGCHYDGEAISTQSANDDASGCAIELGVARALGEYWHSHNVYPARTLRFVIFDAEEQGLFGSYHYLNQTINGDINNIVAMFNEEQNGIAYPLRFLGQMANPLLPFYILTSPLKNNYYYPNQDKLTTQQRQNIMHFDALMQQAVTPVFQQFQALGYTSLPYYNSNNQSTNQPVFTSDQQSNIQQVEDNIGGSDENPFTQAGLPCATFVGNSTYYDQNPPPPKWSYPFDQPQDTIQLMNTFASGRSQQSEALTLALAIPGMFTTWMLNQPDILDSVPATAKVSAAPVVAISDIGQTVVNKNLAVSAQPLSASTTSSPWTYSWKFGDGTSASGASVNHTYTTTGTYTLSLTASTTTGSRTVFKTINVVNQSTSFNNLFAQFPSNGVPPVNRAVTLPVPGNNPAVQAPSTTPTTTSQPDSSPGTSNTFRDLIIGVLVVALLAMVTIIGLTRRTRHV